MSTVLRIRFSWYRSTLRNNWKWALLQFY